MPKSTFEDESERAAAGMEFDEPLQDRASDLGEAMASDGPNVLLDELEELLPEAWRDQIASFPITAVILGIGVGVFLGMKKGDEIIAAGSSLVTATATANLSKVLSRVQG